MSPTAPVTLASEDVRSIVGDITTAFLSASAEPAADGSADADEVVAVVRFSGAFTGSLVCTTSEDFAVLCASRMLAVERDAVDTDALSDAVGEVANMIAGSIKALLPEPSTLSLPVVTLDGQDATSGQEGAVVTTVDLRCADEPVRVSVLAHS